MKLKIVVHAVFFLASLVSFAMEQKEGIEIAISTKTFPVAQDALPIDPICKDDLSGLKWPELFTVHEVQGVPHSFHAKCIYEWVVEKGQRTCPTCRLPISLEQAGRLNLTHKFPTAIVEELSESNRLELRKYIKIKAKDTALLASEKQKKALEVINHAFVHLRGEIRGDIRREQVRVREMENKYCKLATAAGIMVGINAIVLCLAFSNYM